MAEKAKDSNVTLRETSRETTSSIVYALKIKNFFTLPEHDGTHFESPTFEFAHATWRFQFFSYDQQQGVDKDGSKRFDIHMVRIRSEKPRQKIFCIITLLDANDEEYDDCAFVHLFKEDYEVGRYMGGFNNKIPSFDRRDTLSLIIRLFCDEPKEVEENQVQNITDRDLKSLSHDLKDVLLNGLDHNLTLNVMDKEFRAHHDILRARSDIFRSMLSHDMLEKKNGVINIPDCEPQAFEQFLLYIYTGKIEIMDEHNMFGLYYAADKYNMAHLKEECHKFIKKSLSVKNVCEAIELAVKYDDADLKNYAVDYFINNSDEIFPTVEWQLFLEKNSTAANELVIKSFKKVKDNNP